MGASKEAMRSAIQGAFKKTPNSLGPCITKTKIVQQTTPAGVIAIPVPVVGVAYVDDKLAGAIAGAVSDGLANFLP